MEDCVEYMYLTVGKLSRMNCPEQERDTLTENKTNQTSDAQPAARVLLRLTVLAYFSFIIATISFFWYILGQLTPKPGTGVEEIVFTLVLLSAYYLAFSLVIIPHVWYLYRGIKRRMGSEGPSVGVGIIVPTVTGYSIFVLGPLLGVYPSTVVSAIRDILDPYISSNLLGYSVGVVLVGPFYIVLLDEFLPSAQKDEPASPKKADGD